MKTTILLSFVVLCFLCFVNTEKCPTANFQGDWVWVESTGGLANQSDTPSISGREATLEITNSSLVWNYDGDIKFEEPTFVFEDETIHDSEKTTQILVGGVNRTILIDENSGDLIMQDECYGCYTHRFAKQ